MRCHFVCNKSQQSLVLSLLFGACCLCILLAISHSPYYAYNIYYFICLIAIIFMVSALFFCSCPVCSNINLPIKHSFT